MDKDRKDFDIESDRCVFLDAVNERASAAFDAGVNTFQVVRVLEALTEGHGEKASWENGIPKVAEATVPEVLRGSAGAGGIVDDLGFFHTIKSVSHKWEMRVEVAGKGGTVSSTILVNPDAAEDDEPDPDWKSAVDVLESLVLAQACAGIDITTDAYRDAIEVVLEKLSNTL
jgi:hypothetical protein